MTLSIAFKVPGEVRGKGRPRFVRATGRTYTDAQTASYENLVKMAATEAMAGQEPWPGAVVLTLIVVQQVPASTPKKRAIAMLHHDIRPTKKPDCSNVAKAVEDAMNGIVYKDDSQIVHLSVAKYYGATPGVEVLVLGWAP